MTPVTRNGSGLSKQHGATVTSMEAVEFYPISSEAFMRVNILKTWAADTLMHSVFLQHNGNLQ